MIVACVLCLLSHVSGLITYRTWPNGRIPVDVRVPSTNSYRETVDNALARWNASTCVKFVPIPFPYQGQAVLVITDAPNSECTLEGTNNTQLPGYTGRNTTYAVGGWDGSSGCPLADLLRALGRVIGLEYTHRREVASQYVNISESLRKFDSSFSRGEDSGLFAYDFFSIMHVPHNAFTNDLTQSSLIPRDRAGVFGRISAGDSASVNFFYMNCDPLKQPPLCAHSFSSGSLGVEYISREPAVVAIKAADNDQFKFNISGIYKYQLVFQGWESFTSKAPRSGNVASLFAGQLTWVEFTIKSSQQTSDSLNVDFRAPDGTKASCSLRLLVIPPNDICRMREKIKPNIGALKPTGVFECSYAGQCPPSQDTGQFQGCACNAQTWGARCEYALRPNCFPNRFFPDAVGPLVLSTPQVIPFHSLAYSIKFAVLNVSDTSKICVQMEEPVGAPYTREMVLAFDLCVRGSSWWLNGIPTNLSVVNGTSIKYVMYIRFQYGPDIPLPPAVLHSFPQYQQPRNFKVRQEISRYVKKFQGTSRNFKVRQGTVRNFKVRQGTTS